MPTTKYRSSVEIIVRPSTSKKTHPLTAYIAGTQIEGIGHTVLGAVEDLFTTAGAARVAKELEKEVAENAASWPSGTAQGKGR